MSTSRRPSRPDTLRAGPRRRMPAQSRPQPTHPPLTLVDLDEETRAFKVGDASRLLTQVSDSSLRFSAFRGGGSWHVHQETDECFLVLKGELQVDLEGGQTLRVRRHQLATVPAGRAHRARSLVPTAIVCFKPLVGPTRLLE